MDRLSFQAITGQETNTVGACRLLLLGAPLVLHNDRSKSIRLRKALALAAYLAVERRAFTREFLAALLWPEQDQRSSLANVRRMLTHLRSAMGGRCIKTDSDLVQLDFVFIEVDVDKFQSLLQSRPPDAGLEHLETAAGLYRGSFLEGFNLSDCPEFDEWQDGIRMRLEGQLDSLLESLWRGHLIAGRVREALPAAQRWLEQDSQNEVAHRALMEIHARMGRADLARRQFESCVRILSRQGLQPEEQTRELQAAIAAHRLGPDSGASAVASGEPLPGAVRDRLGLDARATAARLGSGRRRRWLIALICAAVLLAASAILAYVDRGYLFGCDLSVTLAEPVRQGAELASARIAFRAEGIGVPNVRYNVAFSSDPTVMAPRDYVVYADGLRMRRDREITVDLDRWSQIQPYVDAHGVRIPPGNYFLSVIVDPEKRIREDSELNNRMTSSTRFFYPGTAPEAALALVVRYRGPGALDPENPLKLFVGDGSYDLQQEAHWARFVVAAEGTYFLPVDDIPQPHSNQSGLVLVLIHDAGNNLERPISPGPGDISAIYRGGTSGLAYGVFDIASAAAVYPGRRYTIEFSASPPAADPYEDDDYREVGTVIDYAALPVRQRHTFHDEGTGDVDQDWFRITLRPGDTLTAETFSAGGAWECDTAIDISDTEHYIRTANDKSEDDRYSRLSYTNNSGTEQVFFLQVKPYMKYASGINRFADYIVELRR